MIGKEEQNKLTENAWAKLYQRLEQDGLLTERTPKKSILKLYRVRWAAAVAILLICSVSAFILMRPSGTSTMLTLHNEKGKPALATTLEDGSTVLLGEQTSLYYPSHFDEAKREVSLNGKAVFSIMANAEKPFFIETELVRVEVMGTRFNVECDDHSSFSLSVKSGEVKTVLKKNNQIVHVKAGESVFLAYSGLQKTAGSNSNIFDSYLNNLHFKDERLENVTKIISELSDSVQLYTSPEVANRLITITLTDSSPITMAELICQALDLSLKQNGNVFTISKKS